MNKFLAKFRQVQSLAQQTISEWYVFCHATEPHSSFVL